MSKPSSYLMSPPRLPQWISCSAGDTGDLGLIPGSGRSPGGGHGNPLQYSCLENPMDRGAWWATVHGVTKSQTRLINYTRVYTHTHRLPRTGLKTILQWVFLMTLPSQTALWPLGEGCFIYFSMNMDYFA